VAICVNSSERAAPIERIYSPATRDARYQKIAAG